MADAFRRQSVQSHVVETSIDLVQKHTFHTTSVAGTKRTSGQSSLEVPHMGQPRDAPSAFPRERSLFFLLLDFKQAQSPPCRCYKGLRRLSSCQSTPKGSTWLPPLVLVRIPCCLWDTRDMDSRSSWSQTLNHWVYVQFTLGNPLAFWEKVFCPARPASYIQHQPVEVNLWSQMSFY